MKIYRGFSEAESEIPPCIYAIGNFDGVHLGHLSLLQRAGELAHDLNVAAGVYTFWPHPQTILNRKALLSLICTREQKTRLLQLHGVEQIVEEPFTSEFAGISAEVFVKDVLAKTLRARGVVVGENFRFGHNAEGSAQKLREWFVTLGLVCEIIPPVLVRGEVCSSSRIRQLVLNGAVVEASSLLGRAYSIIGTVVKGAGRGQTIGIPTANLQSASSLIPGSGVYSTLVRLAGRETVLKAATNIGTRPTFSGLSDIHIETHILDFNENIYGEQLEIYFVEKIRDEKKFGSADELIKQIRADLEQAKAILKPSLASGGGRF